MAGNVIRLDKRGFEFMANWLLVLFVLTLVLSFLLSRVVVDAWVNYLVTVFVGVILGRFMFTLRDGGRFPCYVLAFAFILGYLSGLRFGSGFFLFALLVGVMVATYRVLKAAR